MDLEQFGLTQDINTIKADLENWNEGEGEIFVAENGDGIVGFISVFAANSYLGNQKFAIEKYWYCMKEYPFVGAKLLMTVLNWAKAHGCDHFIASKSYTNSRHKSIERLLTRIDAKPFEKTYILEIK